MDDKTASLDEGSIVASGRGLRAPPTLLKFALDLRHMKEHSLRQVKELSLFMDKFEQGGGINLNDPQTWDLPLFPVSVAAQAALISADTLRQWIVRKRVTLWKPQGGMVGGVPAEGEGKAALLSLRGVLHIAAAARLVNKGIDVADAYVAATEWAHFGDGVNYWGEPSDAEIKKKLDGAREPLGLYPDPDWTFLIHYAGTNARVVRVTMKKGQDTIPFKYSDLFGSGAPVPTPPTIVFLNYVDRHARGVCEGFLR